MSELAQRPQSIRWKLALGPHGPAKPIAVEAACLALGRSSFAFFLQRGRPVLTVRPEGAKHLWRRIPPRELSIDLEADGRFGRVTGRAGAS
jgi:hypothetical protein